jgi:DNA helicase-2/ATP-dependent DNA helicase PcrA
MGLDLIPQIGKGAAKMESFVALIEYFKGFAQSHTILELMNEILEKTAYIESLEAESKEEAQSRIENIDEFLSKIAVFEERCKEENEPATLSRFLEDVALVADIDKLEENQDYVILMTLHSAKGLEFPYVYLVGMEDGLFPGFLTISSEDPDDLEEERRLCYVGITRAQKDLTLSYAKKRMLRGKTQYNKMSCFLKEIPMDLMDTGARFEQEKEVEAPQNAYLQAKQAFKQKAFSTGFSKQQFTVTKETSLSYGVGDRVSHVKFGLGTVLEIVEGGRDFEVQVAFDAAGKKKMFASFAKLKKVENQ